MGYIEVILLGQACCRNIVLNYVQLFATCEVLGLLSTKQALQAITIGHFKVTCLDSYFILNAGTSSILCRTGTDLYAFLFLPNTSFYWFVRIYIDLYFVTNKHEFVSISILCRTQIDFHGFFGLLIYVEVGYFFRGFGALLYLPLLSSHTRILGSPSLFFWGWGLNGFDLHFCACF